MLDFDAEMVEKIIESIPLFLQTLNATFKAWFKRLSSFKFEYRKHTIKREDRMQRAVGDGTFPVLAIKVNGL